MKTLLATTIFFSLLAFPAFAQMSMDDMSCADFVAMDSSAQMEAMGSMGSGMESGESSDTMASDSESEEMKSEDMASGEMEVTAESVAEACADQPDMMVNDAIEKAKMGN